MSNNETFFDEVIPELREDKPRTLTGRIVPFYDGTPATEYKLGTNLYERFAPGCFDEQLSKNPEIRCCSQHDPQKILGWTPDTARIWQDSKGYNYETALDDSSYSRDTEALVRAKKLKGNSTEFFADSVEYKREGNRDIRIIKRARLGHFGPVTKPCYQDAGVALREHQEWVEHCNLEDYANRLEAILKTV